MNTHIFQVDISGRWPSLEKKLQYCILRHEDSLRKRLAEHKKGRLTPRWEDGFHVHFESNKRVTIGVGGYLLSRAADLALRDEITSIIHSHLPTMPELTVKSLRCYVDMNLSAHEKAEFFAECGLRST